VLQIGADGAFTYTLTANALTHSSQGTAIDGVEEDLHLHVTTPSGHRAARRSRSPQGRRADVAPVSLGTTTETVGYESEGVTSPARA
jgi:hypothetical protein